MVALAAADVSEAERGLIAEAAARGDVCQGPVTLPGGDGTAAGRTPVGIAVPLVTGGRVLGVLALVGAPETLDLDKSDLPVLTGVAAQLAVALDREHLADLHRVRAEHERRRLQAEVQDLRSALQGGQLVFQSPAMHELLNRTRRVAATETTVLITGESGTGKERLAQTVHQLSARRAKPFVIVDCGAIPATLIDSELFGHERGAFTGAQQRCSAGWPRPTAARSSSMRSANCRSTSSRGCCARAGEDDSDRWRHLPADLRRADRRGHQRRLEDHVSAGGFRADLFYRLTSSACTSPPCAIGATTSRCWPTLRSQLRCRAAQTSGRILARGGAGA